jgi:hypothetical protein
VKEDLNSMAKGRFHCLMVLERFHCLVPLEGSNASWPMEGKGKTPFHFFSLPPNQFYLNLHFLIDLKVLFYHGSRPLFTYFLPFP